MPIVGDRPESGVRIAIERDASKDDPPWIYAGAAHLPDGSHPLTVTVDAAGDVAVSIGPDAPPELGEKVRLIVRTAYRQAKADGEAPAWRIVRWRGEK
ncbi:MAG: hypothetical protein KIT84_24240 [Labilithrix sp.]|nr:hypothetical protein [Labilithrix sp.]MCW5814160.1 hypothetical protein [Labilithrix sp.]